MKKLKNYNEKNGVFKDNGREVILYKSPKKNAVFKNKPNTPLYAFVHAEGSIYIKVPYKTYKKLLKIDRIYVDTKLEMYDECEDTWDQVCHWGNIINTPEDLFRYLLNVQKYFDSFCMELPKIWNVPSQLLYKKVKIKKSNGDKEKISMRKFFRKYLKGVVINA